MHPRQQGADYLSERARSLACDMGEPVLADPRHTVPSSELAMYVGAAGKQLLAYAEAENSRYAAVAYRDPDAEGGISWTHGAPPEVLPTEVRRRGARA